MINFILNVVKTLIISAGIYAFLELNPGWFPIHHLKRQCRTNHPSLAKNLSKFNGPAIMVAAFASRPLFTIPL